MFKRILMTIGLLLATNVAFAQGVLRGTVFDATSGEALPMVNVLAMQNDQIIGGGTTDFDGVYNINGLKVGQYDIKVSYVGYETHLRKGVTVKASGFTVIDVELKPSAGTLDAVEIVEHKVPVFEVGSPESGQRLSDEDLAKMPGSSIDNIVAAVGGVAYDDGGSGSFRGETDPVTMQGNVRKRTGVQAPKEAIAEIQVILGGTPASIGEAIGGTQIITLKPPSSQFKGVIKYETYLDYRLRNSLTLWLTGPLFQKKVTNADGSVYKKPLAGFRYTGVFSYVNSNLYRPKDGRYLMVNDADVRQLEQNPLSYDPISGSINYAGEDHRLYRDNFVEFTRLSALDFGGDASRVPNLSSYSIAMDAAVDFRFSDYATLTLTGEFSTGRSPSVSVTSLPLNMSSAGHGVNDYINYAVTLDFTQRFQAAKPAADATMPAATPAISNVMYNVTGMFNRYSARSYNQMYGSSLDDVFKYGHIGYFETEKVPSYELQNNYDYHGVSRAAYVQNNWYDVLTYQGGSEYNPILANYNNQLYYSEETEDIRPYLSTRDFLLGYKGLMNGDSPGSIYGLLSNVGVQSSGFSMSRSDYIYLQAKAEATINNKHTLEIGFQYDRSSTSAYSLGAYSLWTIMRQSANRHILQMDTENPHYEWRGSDLYVSYDRLVTESAQTPFDAAMREHLGLGASDWLDIDRYDPQVFVDAGGLSMFSANELFNSGNQIVSYYGYDHTGNIYNGKDWNLEKFFNADENGFQYLPAFTPIYMAGYVQDKFALSDLIFNVGVRVDYFDGNQYVLKDPYLLYQSYTVSDLYGGSIAYNGSLLARTDANGNLSNGDWVVYVDDAAANTPNILGYRNGSVWYDANGVEISSPSVIAGKSGKPTPYRTPDGQAALTNNTVDGSADGAFEKYKPQVVVQPRVAFSFPVGDNSQFKASYDIIARRPSSGWQADYLSYLYMSKISAISNPNLKPERVTNYELGFQQKLNESSAISITAYYKETRDLIQLVQYAGADPNQNYYSYDNIDFKTIKGLTVGYDLRQTKNIRINANYTLQYAEGTGLSTTTMQELIKEGYTTLKMLNPIDDDRRHEFKANVDFRYFGGAKYNGPVIPVVVKEKDADGNVVEKRKEIKVLENFGINFIAVAQSGKPYTKAFSNTQSTIVGSYRGARLPWGFYFDAVVDKSWPIIIKNAQGRVKRETYLNVSLTVTNVFDIRNVRGVYAVTGNPQDNGYLTDPETQAIINNYLDPTSYRDLYTIYLSNANWNYSTPRLLKLALTYQF